MGTNTMYVHRMGHAATIYTHTHRGKHYTCLNMVHTIHTHTNSCTLHARCELVLCTFSSIELFVCMFKRTLILFSISVWD